MKKASKTRVKALQSVPNDERHKVGAGVQPKPKEIASFLVNGPRETENFHLVLELVLRTTHLTTFPNA